MFCFVQLTTPFRERLQILLKSHRFIGSEPYPLPSPMDLSAQAGLLNFWKLGGQSRRVNIAVTLTQALINQPYRWQQTVTRAILSGFTGLHSWIVITRQLRFISRHRRYRPFPGTLSLFAGGLLEVILAPFNQNWWCTKFPPTLVPYEPRLTGDHPYPI